MSGPTLLRHGAVGMTYEEALAYVYSFANYEVSRVTPQTDLKLSRIARMLDLAGHPERTFPSVLVAGTKGKGSTAAMLAAIAHSAGKHVGFYSSPHLNSHRERYRVDGSMIDKEEFARLVDDLPALVAQLEQVAPELGAPSTFELTTLVAFQYFAQRAVDLAVVEVGLGGRLDTTNILDADMSIITSISYDHRDVLGYTLTAIAGEKAGIIKPGRPVISSPQADEAAVVIARVGQEREAPLTIAQPAVPAGEPVRVQAGEELPQRIGQSFRAADVTSDQAPLWMNLLGEHQLLNAGVAMQAACQLGFNPQAMRGGFDEVSWPGRLEVVHERPLIVADGAHNGDSMEKLKIAVERHFAYDRLRVIVGFSSDKEIGAMAEVLNPFADEIIVTRSRHPRAAQPSALLEYFPGGRVAETLEEAFELALASPPRDLTVVTGSLFPVGGARSFFGVVAPEDQDPLP